METKKELEAKIREIEENERIEKERIRRENNFESFKKRGADWVIGRAHAEPTFKDNGWHHPKGIQMPQTVSICGNTGHTYIPTAKVTESTMTFFHNVWSHGDRASFEKALEELVQKEVERIANKLPNVLEILGLQSNDWHLRNDYLEDKQKEVEDDIWAATKELLDRYSDDDFKNLYREVTYSDGEGNTTSRIETGLSHSNHILRKYLKENRPHLLNVT